MTPSTETELAEIVAAATAPLRIAGGGTRRVAGGGAPVLSTAALSGIVDYEPGALTLILRAGTPLAEVEAALAAEGQRLAFEPMDHRALLGTSGTPTIGGIVAGNVSGPRRVSAVGACRDALLGLRFVDGMGRVLKNGGRVMKNVTGYDLVKLMAGSQGRLGVITEISLKVLPAPETEATILIEGLSVAEAVAAMSRALGSPYEVSGAAHWPGRGTFLRIEGFAPSVAYRTERLCALLGGTVAPGPWADIRDVAPMAGQAGDVWRLSVRPSDAADIVARAGAEAALLDWGGGLIWLLTAPGTDLRARLGAFDGHATLLRGVGLRDHPEAPAVAALTTALRRRFDPRGLFHAEGNA